MSDERRLDVLRAIVEDYVAKQEPVGSRALVERHQLGVSLATIRNDMAVLEDEGYIAQPHTSALGEEAPAPSCDTGKPLDRTQATEQVAADFPATSVTRYRAIVTDTVGAGGSAGLLLAWLLAGLAAGVLAVARHRMARVSEVVPVRA